MGKPHEGDLYRRITVADRTFEIRYGYASDAERTWWDPTPVYPDFLREPQFTAAGQPFAAAFQDVCGHYAPKAQVSGENWCNDCKFFTAEGEPIGLCLCPDCHAPDAPHSPGHSLKRGAFMKKLLTALLLPLLVVLLLTGSALAEDLCPGSDDGTHAPRSDYWSGDETWHWHDCGNSYCGAELDKAKHTSAGQPSLDVSSEDPTSLVCMAYFPCTASGCEYYYNTEVALSSLTPAKDGKGGLTYTYSKTVQFAGKSFPLTWTYTTGCDHLDRIWYEAAEATCDTPAMSEGWECDFCGASETPVETAPALGHDMEPDDSTFIEPTCTEPGMTGREACIRCDHATEPEEIPPLEHNIEEYDAFEPTCMTYGKTAGWLCLRCKEGVPQETLDPLGHIEVIIPGQEGTCEEPGMTEGKYCERCNETLVPSVPMGEAPGHDMVPDDSTFRMPTCTEPGMTGREVCTQCDHATEPEEIAPLEHDIEEYEGFAPTCTAYGKTEGWLCVRCKEGVPQETLAPLDHDLENDGRGYAASCEHAGRTDGLSCTRCDYSERSRIIPAYGHKLTRIQSYVPATCTMPSQMSIWACDNEGCSHTEGDPNEQYVSALTHDYQPYELPATCTTDGLDDALRCTRCLRIKDGVTLPAGHQWGSWKPIDWSDTDRHQRTCALNPSHTEVGVCTNVLGECPECGRKFDTQTMMNGAFLANASGNLPNKITGLSNFVPGADVFLVPETGEEGATLNFPSPLADDKTIMEFVLDYGGKQAVHPDDMLHPSMLETSNIPEPTFEFTLTTGQPMISVRGPVYDEPDLHSTQLTFLTKPQNVILLETNGTWIYIATDIVTGWLHYTNVLSESADPTIYEDNELTGARAMLKREFLREGEGASFDILCDVLFAHRTDPNVGQILEEKLREKIVLQDDITYTLAIWPEALKRLNDFYQAAADAQAAYEKACADAAAARAFAETYEYVPKPQDLIPPAYEMGNGETAQFMFVSGKIYADRSENAPVLGTVSSYGRVLGFSNNWYKVEVLDITGWIPLDSSRPYMQPDEKRLYEFAMQQVTGLSRDVVEDLVTEVHTGNVEQALKDLADIRYFASMGEEERRAFAETWIKANKDYKHAQAENRKLQESFEQEYQQAQESYAKAVQEYEEACKYNQALLEHLIAGGSSEDFEYTGLSTALAFNGTDGRTVIAVARPVQGTEKDGMTSIPVSSRGGVYALIDTNIDQEVSQGVSWDANGYLRFGTGTVADPLFILRPDGSGSDDGQDDGGIRDSDMSSQMSPISPGGTDGSQAILSPSPLSPTFGLDYDNSAISGTDPAPGNTAISAPPMVQQVKQVSLASSSLESVAAQLTNIGSATETGRKLSRTELIIQTLMEQYLNRYALQSITP